MIIVCDSDNISNVNKQNNKLAIIELNGHQYLTHEGNTFSVELINPEVEPKVLLVKDDMTYVGKPYLSDWGVEIEIIENFKDQKVSVRKFKAKSRYRRNKNHRQNLTMIKIVKIHKGKSSIKTLVKNEEDSVVEGKKNVEEKKNNKDTKKTKEIKTVEKESKIVKNTKSNTK